MIVIAVIALVLGLAQLALAWRIRRTVPPLPLSLQRPSGPVPRVSIIVPAKDEADEIRAALLTKLSCGYPELEVVVVDDRSSDGTGAIAMEVADHDPRVVVARVDELPSGWLGKVHAMHTGLARASGTFVLLSDADVHIEPGALDRAVAMMEREQLDLLAVFPRMDRTGWLVDAAVAALMRALALGGQIWRANDDSSPVGVGVGAFNLVRRSALERSPGLPFLRMEMADDVALGAMLKSQGARCRFVAGRDAVHLVFMPDLAAMARSSEKGGGTLGFSATRTLLVTSIIVAVELGLPLTAIASGGLSAVLGSIGLLAVGLVHVLVAQHFGFRLRGALLWPIGTLVDVALIARAGLLAWWRQGITWRGTFYARDVVERGRRLVGGRVRYEREGQSAPSASGTASGSSTSTVAVTISPLRSVPVSSSIATPAAGGALNGSRTSP